MTIEFHSVLKETRFLDPMNGFAESKRITEIRVDPLTGRTSRILEVPAYVPSKVDLTPLVEKSLQAGCPFCPDRVMAVTPQFPPDVIPEPRIKVGDAIVVCNIFPYDTYSAVCVMSSRHFIAIGDFTEELLVDALLASQSYVRTVMERDPAAGYGTINWNYMPLSGGTVVHPHLQVIVGSTPSNYQRELIERSLRYSETSSSNFWSDLVAAERELGVRYVAGKGRIHWLTSFAPKGIVEVMAIFTECPSILDLSREDWSDFAFGLAAVARYLGDLNFHSFNMALFSGERGASHFWANARVIPRFLLSNTFGTSDFNHFSALHNEVLSRIKPEDACRELRPYFE